LNNKLAVIIPVYNGELFIEKAVKSIAMQTFQPSEIIVVNDGSTDETGKVLKGLDIASLKVVEQKNSGVALARNTGIKESQSDVLAFMDVDDFWHSQKLEIQYKELEKGSYDLIYTDVVRVSESEVDTPEHSLIADIEGSVSRAMSIEKIIYKPHLTTSSVMVKRNAYEAVGGFDEAFKTAEDQVFYMDIANSFKIGCINLPLTFKRYVKNSLSAGINTYYDSLKALDRFESKYPKSANQYRFTIRKARARIYRDLGSELLWKRETSQALNPLLMSMKKAPSIDVLILLAKYVVISIFKIRKAR